jgi:carbon storage regulator CsrA
MLVLTRRENEKIVFPEVGITVEVVSISGSRARLGVEAPAEIRILRHEIAEKELAKKPITFSVKNRPQLEALAKQSQSSNPSHAVRNYLNSTSIAAQLLRRQLDMGLIDDAEATVQTLLAELSALNTEITQPSTEKPSQTKSAASAAPAHRPTALLVEDNDNERVLLAGFLKMVGFEVVTAENGVSALEYLTSHERPDVVLLDMLMPECDGPTAVSRIRRHAELDGLRIFAVSGTSPAKFGLETGPRGIDRWFHKPINPEELAREMAKELVS